MNDLLISNPHNEDIQDKLQNVQQELENANDEESKGTIIRSQAKWSEDGEQTRSIF